MKIKEITVRKVEIPMVSVFTTAFGSIKTKPTVLVTVRTADGLLGWGESALLPFPMYNPEAVDSAIVVLKKYLAPLVIRRNTESIEEINRLFKSVRENNIAKTGIETAVWDIESQIQGKSLSKLLEGKKPKIEVGESIGIKNSLEETLEEISLRVYQGFRRIKIKIKPGWDIKVIRAVRSKFPDIPLMVDGNSGYTLTDINTIKKLDDFNLMMIEQPLADDDIIDHAVLQKLIKTPVCLDESILSAEDARKAISIGACKIINIKPGRVGGLYESKKINDLCRKNSIGCWIGGMLEYGVGRAFNVAAASMDNCIFPADLSPSEFYYKDSIINHSLDVNSQGLIDVPTVFGLENIMDKKIINRYTRAKIIIH